MNYKQADIESVVNVFMSKNLPIHRYASFDYCYNYFKVSSRDNILKDKEKSSLVIGFYLASWGMMRGSSFLLQKSLKHFQPLIEYIAEIDKSVWDIDVDNYTNENISKILEIYGAVKLKVVDEGKSELTLTTKVLLGVFGFVPAFDQYFCNTFREIFPGCGFRRFNENSLKCISDFYSQNNEVVDKLSRSMFTTDFYSGQPTNINYPKAKIMDMYGFIKNLPTNEL